MRLVVVVTMVMAKVDSTRDLDLFMGMTTGVVGFLMKLEQDRLEEEQQRAHRSR